MFKYITGICVLIVFCISYSVAQPSSKVKINLIGRDIKELAAAGLETDHGIFVKNRYFISDFSQLEIEIINKLHFETEVLIDDVSSWYVNPTRSSDLQNVMNRSQNCKGIEVGEYPYKTPEQYRVGSMNGYFTYEEMLNILDSMALKYPKLISQRAPIDTFLTYGGRPIYYIKVSDNVETDESSEPQILYTALHHAREPNSLSQMIFYLWYLLENYEKDPLVAKIINETAMYFIPCVNPDGYIHNQTTNPNGGGLWRKNMWKDTTGALKGVDLNRNYGYFWGIDNQGSSNNPNSATFRGPQAFSEPETKAIRSFCLQHNFKIAQNYHTYGNYLVHPWGFNDMPTAEDKLFKMMGSVMNSENNFVMGTGTETVGYVVNGDSDDWMYGTIDEKSPIYAYTPEVGPSFWPAKVDIDYLNRSCLWTNLSTAFLTLSHYDAKDITGTPFLSATTNQIVIKVDRAGLKDGACIVGLTAQTSGVSVVEQPTTILINKAGESTNLIFTVLVAQGARPDVLNFVLTVTNEGISKQIEITKTWVEQPFVTIYKNSAGDISLFETSGWSGTTDQFFSAPMSMTDSPLGNYNNENSSTITLNQSIDLTDATHALLSFYAKWDLENNYDYVQVLVSTDNVDFVPLCGKYTNTGTSDQQFGSPLYDGTQSEWVKEEISLEDFIGKPEVWVRFLIQTDQYEQRDGFYFDDLEVTASYPYIINTTENIEAIYLYPTVSDGKAMIYIKGSVNFDGNTEVSLFDILGKNIGNVFVDNGTVDLKSLELVTGLYTYQVKSKGNLLGSGKLVVSH